jgi:hypothetical protein
MFGRFNIPAVREFYGSTEGTYGTINIRTLIVSPSLHLSLILFYLFVAIQKMLASHNIFPSSSNWFVFLVFIKRYSHLAPDLKYLHYGHAVTIGQTC